MPARQNGMDFSSGGIELYLQYDFLPLGQYAGILRAVDNAYLAAGEALISPRYRELEGQRLFFSWNFRIGSIPPPLTVADVRTGESITTRVSFDRKLIPGLSADPDGAVHLHLPFWSTALAVAAMALSWGQEAYKRQLEIRNLELSNERIRLELDDLRRDTLLDHSNPATNALDSAVADFHARVMLPNISQARINDLLIKADYRPTR